MKGREGVNLLAMETTVQIIREAMDDDDSAMALEATGNLIGQARGLESMLQKRRSEIEA